MHVTQSIPAPNGVTVFGSGRTRVEPDVATFQFTVTAKNKRARRAFDQLQEKVVTLRRGLSSLGVDETDAQVSRLTADKMFLGSNTEAVTTFSVRVKNLAVLTDTLVYIIDNKCLLTTSVKFHATQLADKRGEARTRAVQAAREKAERYADAAGVSLGSPIHMEDLNPDALTTGHQQIDHFTGRLTGMEVKSTLVKDEGLFDASWLPVDAAVMVTYEILPKN